MEPRAATEDDGASERLPGGGPDRPRDPRDLLVLAAERILAEVGASAGCRSLGSWVMAVRPGPVIVHYELDLADPDRRRTERERLRADFLRRDVVAYALVSESGRPPAAVPAWPEPAEREERILLLVADRAGAFARGYRVAREGDGRISGFEPVEGEVEEASRGPWARLLETAPAVAPAAS